MNDRPKDEQALTKPSDSLPTSKRRNLLEEDTLTKLSATERAEIEKSVVREQVRLDAEAKAAADRFEGSSRDMARDVQLVRSLEESTRGDFTVDGRYDTASGRTTVKVRRQSNLTILIIAIVMGLVALVLLTR